MGAVGRKQVGRIAYRLLNILSLYEYIIKIFWVEGDVHVRAMFELHQRYASRSEAGPSSTWAGQLGLIAAPPLRIATPSVSMEMDSGSEGGSSEDYQEETEESTDSFDEAEYVDESQVDRMFLLPASAPIPESSSVSSHFHSLHLDAIHEEPREAHGGGGNDYLNLDGGEEFRVGHRFSCREAVHMEMKNYDIRRAAEYRVLESDQNKYVCRCKQHDSGCPWRVRVAFRGNKEVRGATLMSCPVNVSRSRVAGQQSDMSVHITDNQVESVCGYCSVAKRNSTEIPLQALLQKGLDCEAKGNCAAVWRLGGFLCHSPEIVRCVATFLHWNRGRSSGWALLQWRYT
ncbi:hypothetical protein PIB30_032382 [Stylosanthes scabra]|uniref:Transposase MuDR plant domain-containing protein n=1 Tax=Stylosanthes scabra TaxID=79078 RepID=A0ABU6VBX6_9FABA|nr:hypothetical protein [Stylosanthes scabra]